MAENHNDPAAFPPLEDTLAPAPGLLVADHFIRGGEYETYRSKGTRDWLITFTLDGEGTYLLDGNAYPCTKGDLIILLPGTTHHYHTKRGITWDFMWAHFVPLPGWNRYLQWPELTKGLLHVNIQEPHLFTRVRQCFLRMIGDSRRTGAFHEELALNALEEALLVASGQLASRARQSIDPRVEQVLTFLTENLQHNRSVSELARMVSLSPSRLAHLFKQQVGDSIVETLIKLRLRHAARLLEYTNRSIGEISQDVGFQSPFYFAKQFTAFYGMNPTSYRKNKGVSR